MSDTKQSGGVSVEVTTEGAKLSVSDKVVDRTSSALALLFSKRIARSRIDLAMAERLAKKIEGGDYGLEPAEQAFLSRVYAKEIRQFENQQRILDRAQELLPEARRLLPAGNNEVVDAAATSDDWVDRFLENAGHISEERLRELYARIAAGEVVRPGRFSMKALSVVLDLDGDTVSAWQKLRPLVFERNYLIPYKSMPELYRKRGLSYEIFVHLETCGLIKLDDIRPTTADPGSDPKAPICRVTYGSRTIRYRAKNSTELCPETWRLTPVGEQLMELHPFVEDDEFFRLLIAYIARAESATLMVTDVYRQDLEWSRDGVTWEKSAG